MFVIGFGHETLTMRSGRKLLFAQYGDNLHMIPERQNTIFICLQSGHFDLQDVRFRNFATVEIVKDFGSSPMSTMLAQSQTWLATESRIIDYWTEILHTAKEP